jgi:hypothetical protein
MILIVQTRLLQDSTANVVELPYREKRALLEYPTPPTSAHGFKRPRHDGDNQRGRGGPVRRYQPKNKASVYPY